MGGTSLEGEKDESEVDQIPRFPASQRSFHQHMFVFKSISFLFLLRESFIHSFPLVFKWEKISCELSPALPK